jgi:hypothetical protein
MATDIERASWREACDMAGRLRMRLRLEHRRNEFSPEHACEIESWLSDKEKELSDKDKEARPTETRRSNTIRDWTIVAAWAGLVAAIGSTDCRVACAHQGFLVCSRCAGRRHCEAIFP